VKEKREKGRVETEEEEEEEDEGGRSIDGKRKGNTRPLSPFKKILLDQKLLFRCRVYYLNGIHLVL